MFPAVQPFICSKDRSPYKENRRRSLRHVANARSRPLCLLVRALGIRVESTAWKRAQVTEETIWVE